MNKRKLDNMFREKLHDHVVTPRPEAWTKLKGNLDSDRNKVIMIYWRVAAIIILLLTSVFFIYKIKKTESQAPVTDNQQKMNPEIINKDNSSTQTQENLIKNRIDPIEEPPKKEENLAQYKAKSTKPALKEKSLAENQQVKPLTKKEEVKPANISESHALAFEGNAKTNKSFNLIKPARTKAMKPIAPKELSEHPAADQMSVATLDKRHKIDNIHQKSELPNVTITFKSDESEHSENPENQGDEISKVKKFALRKMISLARDIKAGEAGISTLREKKDEFLALNFNKKKNVKNSK